jgi:hypothetical protein
VKDFPELDDITTPIPVPFAISGDGDWWAVGIGQLGMILRHGDDPTVLRWIGQVVKFCPQDEYLAPETIFENLREQGIVGIEWRSMS